MRMADSSGSHAIDVPDAENCSPSTPPTRTFPLPSGRMTQSCGASWIDASVSEYAMNSPDGLTTGASAFPPPSVRSSTSPVVTSTHAIRCQAPSCTLTASRD